jgi:hypothetical protein
MLNILALLQRVGIAVDDTFSSYMIYWTIPDFENPGQRTYAGLSLHPTVAEALLFLEDTFEAEANPQDSRAPEQGWDKPIYAEQISFPANGPTGKYNDQEAEAWSIHDAFLLYLPTRNKYLAVITEIHAIDPTAKPILIHPGFALNMLPSREEIGDPRVQSATPKTPRP